MIFPGGLPPSVPLLLTGNWIPLVPPALDPRNLASFPASCWASVGPGSLSSSSQETLACPMPWKTLAIWTGLQSSYSTIHGPLDFLDRRQMADMGPSKCMLVPLRVTKGTPPSSSQQTEMVELTRKATAISTVLSLHKYFFSFPFSVCLYSQSGSQGSEVIAWLLRNFLGNSLYGSLVPHF